MDYWLRRFSTVIFWPLVDSALTITSYFLIAKLGVVSAIIGIAILAISLNFFFLYLLSFEKEAQQWIAGQFGKIAFWQRRIPGLDRGAFLSVLLVYSLSGPAMLGAPLLWLLGIKGRKRVFLVVVGITLNSIIWVGGVHNAVWLLIERFILERYGIM